MVSLIEEVHKINNDWTPFFIKESKKEYFTELSNRIQDEFNRHTCYPVSRHIFRVFEKLEFKSIKVVILGQDPYHTKNFADGFAFSTKNNKIPPSLKNIFKQIEFEFNITPKSSDLTQWVSQGVFLLNTVLTVREGHPLSHRNLGWEKFTRNVLREITQRKTVVFLAMGVQAQNLIKELNLNTYYVINTSHPSPFAFNKNFYRRNIFKKINEILKHNELLPILW